jgi:hypothetical protein
MIAKSNADGRTIVYLATKTQALASTGLFGRSGPLPLLSLVPITTYTPQSLTSTENEAKSTSSSNFHHRSGVPARVAKQTCHQPINQPASGTRFKMSIKPITNHQPTNQSPITNHQSPITNHQTTSQAANPPANPPANKPTDRKSMLTSKTCLLLTHRQSALPSCNPRAKCGWT